MKTIILTIHLFVVVLCSARSPEETITGMFSALSQTGLPGAIAYVHDSDLTDYNNYVSGYIAKVRELETKDPKMKAVIEKLGTNFDALPAREYIKAGLSAMGGADPETIRAFRELSVDVIGHVTEGNLAHVVVRMRIPQPKGFAQEIKVFTVKELSGDYWYVRNGGGTLMAQLFEK